MVAALVTSASSVVSFADDELSVTSSTGVSAPCSARVFDLLFVTRLLLRGFLGFLTDFAGVVSFVVPWVSKDSFSTLATGSADAASRVSSISPARVLALLFFCLTSPASRFEALTFDFSFAAARFFAVELSTVSFPVTAN